jgi:demethylmenaquinone methyltransferase/2-methoxy-6-polyprenyl-1,4-benzoquinol methylase
MFDRIAGRYDLLNRLLSGGTDVAWRRRMAKHMPNGENLRLLDLATGTGDVLLAMHKQCPRVQSGVGMDLSGGMLAVGRRKIVERGLAESLRMVRADAVTLGARKDSFDAATIAFGIRNVPNVPRGLSEMHRVLKPGGRVLILEFSIPGNALLRAPYLFYFRHILPVIGGIISGDRTAYKYLNQTVEAFPYGEAFCDLMRNAGFRDVQAFPLTFGIATLYQGEKATV